MEISFRKKFIIKIKKNLIKICDVNKIILQGDNYILMRSLRDNS